MVEKKQKKKNWFKTVAKVLGNADASDHLALYAELEMLFNGTVLV